MINFRKNFMKISAFTICMMLVVLSAFIPISAEDEESSITFSPFATAVGTQTVNHGNKYNFIYHTKVKDAALFDDDGIPTYFSKSDKDPYFKLTLKYKYKGTEGNDHWENPQIQFFIQDKREQNANRIEYYLLVTNGGKLNWVWIEAERAKKIATSGLDIFIAHIGSDSKDFGVYVGDDGSTPTLKSTMKMSNANHSYEITQTVNGSSAIVTTTGYETTYTTVKDTANAFNTIANKEVPITATVGDNVTSNISEGTYRIGDLIEFTADVAGDNVLNVTANGEKLTAKCGTFTKVLTVNDLKGIKFNLSSLEEFKEFASHYGDATDKDRKNKDIYNFVYHINLQSDTLFDENGNPTVTDNINPYFNLTLLGWGDTNNTATNKYDNIYVKFHIQKDDNGKIKYLFQLKSQRATKSDWCELKTDQELNMVKKIGSKSGLNIYVVHNETQPLLFELYCENEKSDGLVKLNSITAILANHVYNESQSIKDGGSITTRGYQVNGDYNNITAATELFWKKGLPATGDANDDGKFNICDLVSVNEFIDKEITAINTHSADYNNDRKLTADDLSLLRTALLIGGEEPLQYQSAGYMNKQLYYDNSFDSESVKGADPAVFRITDKNDSNYGKYILTLTGDAQSIDTYIGEDLANWKKKRL